MEDEVATPVAHMKKIERSPSFPFIGLTKALDRVRGIYSHAKRHELRITDAADAWGVGAKSSGTLQTVAALIAYGLLDEQGASEARKLRVSELAFRALEDQRPGAREAALSEAAVRPKLIAEYAEAWKDGRPADGVCISELRIDRGFTEDGAKSFLKVFDDTISYRTASSLRQTPEPEKTDNVETEIAIGSTIQWTSNGVNQFSSPMPVIGFSEDKKWLWVTGSATGIPVTEATLWVTAEELVVAPQLPQHLRDGVSTAQQPTVGGREDKFALSEGDVVIRFPDNLSVDSVDDLDDYIKVFLKKVRREAVGRAKNAD